ncbi:High affinity Ca2+/Mn2+ P-type ATPase-like protein [Tulasnella sp. 419]|nr:High affinity Ca2+/Mn2+ P-type ATPase-like protein [Tulasnella sp. 419]
MDRDKKRSSLPSKDEIALASVASSYLHRNAEGNGVGPTARSNSIGAPRTNSPASNYFTTFAEDPDQPPIPAPGAQSHFAYSTTLRRHGPETSPIAQHFHLPPVEGLVNQVLGAVGAERWQQHPSNEPTLPVNGFAPSSASKESTASSRFVHMTADQTLSHFRTSPTGLSSHDIPSLRAHYGYNEFEVGTPEPAYIKFAKTIYESPLILLLFGSAFVSAIMGNIDDAVSITIAIIIVLTVGFVQESRSEKSLESLNKLVPHHCHIIRDGHQLHLLANELVPGDLVKFGVGDRVPADIRLVTAVDLEIDESNLTGETRPAKKTVDPLPQPSYGAVIPPADRTCIAFMGTLVRNGGITCILL